MVDTGINLDEKVNTIREQLNKLEKLSIVEEELRNLMETEEEEFERKRQESKDVEETFNQIKQYDKFRK